MNIRKILSLILASSICLTACATTGSANRTDQKEIEEDGEADALTAQENDWEEDTYPSKENVTLLSKTHDFYFLDNEISWQQELYYVEGEEEIPYIEAGEAEELIEFLYAYLFSEDLAESILIKNEENEIVWSRNDDNEMIIDFETGLIYFDDYNRFFVPEGSSSLELLSYDTYENEDDTPGLFNKLNGTFYRRGNAIAFDMAAHHIDVYYLDGAGYIPLQTFSDLFLMPYNYVIGYNGEIAVINDGVIDESLQELYYSVPSGERSEALAEFTYDELCLALVANYGLKEKHNITTFEEFFALSGLENRLKSTDPKEVNDVLVELSTAYLSDFHSAYMVPSPLLGEKEVKASDDWNETYSTAFIQDEEITRRYLSARAEAYPDGVPAYEEIGNTAYITFDGFVGTDDIDKYYDELPTEADIKELGKIDTIGLMIYAHSQIMRENSPIENVVVDLSNNTGGSVDAAIFTAAWMLGYCALDIFDTATQAQLGVRYVADVNLDGIYDEKDTITSKNIYCLTSPVSFSCGNLVPSLCKEAGTVTLLGATTGGGACIVQNLSLADGSEIIISGRMRLSIVKNGSYYDVDEGVDPDVALTKTSSYYDRVSLTTYLNDLK